MNRNITLIALFALIVVKWTIKLAQAKNTPALY